jgi:putative DNA primase/helicase
MPIAAAEGSGWWYGTEERRIRLEGDQTHAQPGEVHADPTAEAIRWSICEAELIQAMGRGRGVNRTAENPLQIDLLTDVVLPVTVNELVTWSELRPTRRDLMAARGVVFENAVDMAACFPDLWPTADAARQDRSRSVTNCYYRILYNSEMSHSSAVVSYRPEGAGQKPRRAVFDLANVPDPESWLTARLGPLAVCELECIPAAPIPASTTGSPDTERLAALALRLRAGASDIVAARKTVLDVLADRLAAAVQPFGAVPVPHDQPPRNRRTLNEL